MRKIKVGYLAKNYAWKRLILGKVGDCEYHFSIFSNFYFWKYIHVWVGKLIGYKFKRSPDDLYMETGLKYRGIPLVDSSNFLHFFNVISHEKNMPWILNVETAVPWTPRVRKCLENQNVKFSELKGDSEIAAGLTKLASDDCRALLCLSSATKKIQDAIAIEFPEHSNSIQAKTIVLHPPQEIIADDRLLKEKQNAQLNFLFCCTGFFP